jgi:transposase-like protein
MDPTTVFCPHTHGPARGQTGQGQFGIHARQEQRCLCHGWHNTCSATTGTVFYRLRPAAETVVRVVTWLAHGGPVQAIVAAFGVDERPVAKWWARAGRHGPAVPASRVEHPRDVGQGHADERRVKQPGGLVWRARAMMGKPRVWLGGEGSAQRDMALIRQLMGGVKRGAARRPLWGCPEGVVAYIRAMRETLSRSHAHGHGRPAPAAAVAPCLDRPSHHALRAATGSGDCPTHCRWHTGTRGDAPRPGARRRRAQYGRH